MFLIGYSTDALSPNQVSISYFRLYKISDILKSIFFKIRHTKERYVFYKTPPCLIPKRFYSIIQSYLLSDQGHCRNLAEIPCMCCKNTCKYDKCSIWQICPSSKVFNRLLHLTHTGTYWAVFPCTDVIFFLCNIE